MSTGPIPQFVDPRKLADRGSVIDGQLPLSAFSRLMEQLIGIEGDVRAKVSFDRDPRGAVQMRVVFDAQCTMRCQRCLEPMAVPVHGEFAYVVVREGTPPESVPDTYDALEVGEAPLDLLALLEDELLLSLPLAPAHAAGLCQHPVEIKESGAGPEEPFKESPFSVLARLKQDPNA